MLTYQTEADELQINLAASVDYWQTHPIYQQIKIGYNSDGIMVALSIAEASLNEYWPAQVMGSTNPVRRLRQRFGLSQRELALVLGLSKPRISQIESQSTVSHRLMSRIVAQLKAFTASHWALPVQLKEQVRGMELKP